MRGDDSVAYIEPLSNIDFENVSFVSNGYDPDCLTLYRQPLGGTCYGAGELSTVDIHFDFDDVLSSQLPIAIPPPPPPPPRRIFTFGTQEAETSGSSSVDCKDDPAESQQQQQQMFASVVTDGEVAYNDDHNCSSGTKDLSRVSDAVIKCVDFVSVSADDTNLASAFVSDAADNQSFASDLPSPPSPMLFNENGCDDNHPPPPLPASLPPSDARVADAERFDLG